MNTEDFYKFIQENYKLDGEKVIGRRGTEITGGLASDGYRRVKIMLPGEPPRSIAYSRLKFLLAHKELPELLDHSDGDCTRDVLSNLRPATRSHNAANQMKRKAKNKYKGVHPTKHGTFAAQFRGKHLGTFADEVEAAKAYDEAHRDFYGSSFACVNFPKEGERSAI